MFNAVKARQVCCVLVLIKKAAHLAEDVKAALGLDYIITCVVNGKAWYLIGLLFYGSLKPL